MKLNKLAAALTAFTLAALQAMSAAAYGSNATWEESSISDFRRYEVNGLVSIILSEDLKADVEITFDSLEGKDIPYYKFSAEGSGQYVCPIEGWNVTQEDYRYYNLYVTFDDENGGKTPAYTEQFTIPEGDGSEPVIYEYSFTNFDPGTPDVFTVTGLTYPEGEVEMHKSIAVNFNTFVMGDVNFDGKITAIDASAVLVEYTEITDGGGSFTEVQKRLGDVNKDSKITATDATAILRYYTALSSGIEPSWE